MKTHRCTIPAAYQLLDTHVTEANSFANTRDLKKLRDNHNILLARRCKHTILSSSFRDHTSPTAGKTFYNTLSWTGDDISNVLVSCPVIISSQTQKLRLNIYARKLSAAANTDVILSPVIHAMGEAPPQNPSVTTYNITVNNAAYAWFSVDFPVPKMSDSSLNRCMFSLMFYGGAYFPAEEMSGYVLVDSGPDWIVSNFGALPAATVVNKVLSFSDTGITPRLIKKA